MGVRGRLFVAFVSISAFAVLAAAAAMYSFFEVGDYLEQITKKRVPATIASQQLSRQAERIAAVAPVLLTEKMNSNTVKPSSELAKSYNS